MFASFVCRWSCTESLHGEAKVDSIVLFSVLFIVNIVVDIFRLACTIWAYLLREWTTGTNAARTRPICLTADVSQMRYRTSACLFAQWVYVGWPVFVLLACQNSASKKENFTRITCKFYVPFSWILRTFSCWFFHFKIISGIAQNLKFKEIIVNLYVNMLTVTDKVLASCIIGDVDSSLSTSATALPTI